MIEQALPFAIIQRVQANTARMKTFARCPVGNDNLVGVEHHVVIGDHATIGDRYAKIINKRRRWCKNFITLCQEPGDMTGNQQPVLRRNE